MIRAVESDADLEAWLEVRNVVVPNEPATIEQVRRDAERKLEEAERDVQRALLGRGRKRKLESEVVLQRRVIEMCDRQLAKLNERPTPSQVALPHVRLQLVVGAPSPPE